MTVATPARRKRVFIASSQTDVVEVKKAMQLLDLDAITVDQDAKPGTTWMEALHHCISDADLVIGIMGERRKNANVLFELGVASALNKPTLLFIAPDYPRDQVPPFDIPYLRMDVRSPDALTFGLKQMLSLSPRQWIRQSNSEGFTTRPIGAFADELLQKLARAEPTELEDVIYEALRATGALAIARGSEAEDMGVDFAIWSRDLEPTITNPLLIECKSSLPNQAAINEAIGRMYRALDAIQDGCGLVLYKEAGTLPRAALKSLPVLFLSAKDFINGLREKGLAEYVRTLRNRSVHGY